ncbi:MAG: hypothetical protein LBD23_15170 [Oscillospiraceae bacterium]|jgi:hypothetical protein|nr:hypothetical protein [Oscillospiraceae bacterium]
MEQVIYLRNSRPDIGLFTRNTTFGDEHELVEQFVEYFCHEFLRRNKSTRLAVFIEPKIDSGFPDVIFACYSPKIMDNWSERREKLDTIDLKLLTYLYNAGGVSAAQIITILGFPENQTTKSLEKLMDAKLVSYRSGCWYMCQLSNVFSIKKLISVEAKLSNISNVIDQSFVNMRFASHSYALAGTARPQHETIRTFSRHGIGLYCKGAKFKKYVDAVQHTLPSNHLSFLFNEWIGRAISH